MNSVLQIAAEAARKVNQAQALVTNNLANAGTTAFKADLYAAQATYLGDGSRDASAIPSTPVSAVDFGGGSLVATGRDLDIAINGQGWMQVMTPQGEQVLSRRGDLRIENNGNLIDAAGNQIMGEGGPINLPPASSINIGVDGTISLIPLGEAPVASATIDRILLVNPNSADLEKGLDGNIRANANADLEPDAAVTVVVGSLETSNVNSVAAMVQMIELSRSFESHVKTMQSADELDDSSASLMRLE